MGLLELGFSEGAAAGLAGRAREGEEATKERREDGPRRMGGRAPRPVAEGGDEVGHGPARWGWWRDAEAAAAPRPPPSAPRRRRWRRGGGKRRGGEGKGWGVSCPGHACPRLSDSRFCGMGNSQPTRAELVGEERSLQWQWGTRSRPGLSWWARNGHFSGMGNSQPTRAKLVGKERSLEIHHMISVANASHAMRQGASHCVFKIH
ncbi:uncharacterized protein A4U43_C06F1510 [Asparagus officinalis]|uniref:Uncharacterized protein n=1 Tax=Asparagus officinalis TaxID=4686 RepID=A0A5P1EP79_ASPOF|nr:uncharacterized protein A4U43_C06F1510 [Asparagus officinalis]